MAIDGGNEIGPKVIDTFSKPGTREPHRMGIPLDQINSPKKPVTPQTSETISRREFLEKTRIAATTTALTELGGAAVKQRKGIGGFIDRMFSPNQKATGNFSSAEAAAPNPISPENFNPPIIKATEKIQRGDTSVTLNKELRIRRDTVRPVAVGNEHLPEDNSVEWSNIKSLNGVDLGEAKAFRVSNAELVVGDPVDDNLLGKYWIKFNAELKSGENTVLYLSRSNKTAEYVNARGEGEPVMKDDKGNIISPDGIPIGKLVIEVNPTPTPAPGNIK